jgi:hypothetical protein
MFSRTTQISLRLSMLLAMLVFSILLQPQSPTVGIAFASDCDMTCWEQYCPDMYFDCLEWSSPEACCTGGNFCARSCGEDCPLFCIE